MKSLTVILLSLQLVLAPCAYGDAAGEYKEFVEKMIPLSFELTRESALYQETKVLLDRLSRAQSYLSRASEAALIVARQLEDAGTSRSAACPLTGEKKPDVQRMIFEYQAVSEALNYYAAWEQSMVAYTDLESEFEKACDKLSAFNTYKQETLLLNTTYHPDVSVFDNTYITTSGAGLALLPKEVLEEFAGETATNVLGTGLKLGEAVLIVTGLLSVVVIIFNVIERIKIDKLKTRLALERAQDSHYQEAAQKACVALSISAQPYFNEYKKTYTSLSELFRTMPKKTVENRKSQLQACFKKFEDAYVRYVESKEDEETVTKAGMRNDEVAGVRVAAKLNQSLIVRLKALDQSKRCDQASYRRALTLQSSLALLRLFPSEQKQFVEDKMDTLSQWEKQCNAQY
ncbi:MAG: hypothetical protein H6617_05105 [Bdellovibrionaceae bacterium]|nr:hypothetical protein [Bdellovibrionales bacterium]MCB9254042.1 hypothetical protein [Pseudobdellovibrionaceae bacterium]